MRKRFRYRFKAIYAIKYFLDDTFGSEERLWWLEVQPIRPSTNSIIVACVHILLKNKV